MKKKLFAWISIILLMTLPVSIAESFGSTASGYDGVQPVSPLAQDIASGARALEVSTYGQYLQGESVFFPNDVTNPFTRWRESIYSAVFGPTIDIGEAIVVNVKDYEPKVVRASLLEKQDVPVFITLDGVTPECLFAKVSGDIHDCMPPIQSVVITVNKSSPYVRGFTYVPPRRGGYSLENLGGMMVYLARIRNESAFPENNTIPVDLTARITLNTAQSILGLSEQDRFLEQQSEEKLFLEEEDKSDNSIFAGRGYIRATAVDANAATFVVYNKDLQPISLFSPSVAPAGVPVATMRLRPGESSRPIRLGYSGNPLEDLFVVRLNEVATPADRAQLTLTVDGKSVEVRPAANNFLFPGSQWRVTSVDLKTERTDANKVRALAPYLSEQTFAELQQAGELTLEEHIVRLQSVEGDRKEIIRSIVRKENGVNALEVAMPSDAEVSLLEEEYCPNVVNPAAEEALGHDYACLAIARLKKGVDAAPNGPSAKQAYALLGDAYRESLIDYPACDVLTDGTVRDRAECGRFQTNMLRLAYFYYTKAGDTSKLNLASEEAASIGGFDHLPEDGVGVFVNQVLKKEQKDVASAILAVDNIEKEVHVGDSVPALNGKRDSFDSSWTVSEIQSGYVILRRSVAGTAGTVDSETLNIDQEKEVIVADKTIAAAQQTPGKARVRLVKTNVKNSAHVTLIPAAGRSVVTSNFRVHIGIDERPFKLTPEQLEEKIQDTKELIEKLNGITEKMEKLVQTWKKACLITFGFITAKNAFFGGGSRAIARRTVSQFYKERCADELKKPGSETLDDCLARYTDEMTKDIDTNQRVIDQVDAQLSGKTTTTLETCGDVQNFQQLRAIGVSAEDCKEHLRITKLQKEFPADSPWQSHLDRQFRTFNLVDKNKRYLEAVEQAQSMVNADPQLKEMYKDNMNDLFLKTYRVQQDAREAGERADGLVALPSIQPTSGDFKKAVAQVAGLQDAAGKIPVESIKLVRLNQLQYMVWKGTLNDAVKEPNAVDNVKIARDLQSRPAIDANGNAIWIEDQKFLTQVDMATTAVAGVNLGNVELIGTGGNAYTEDTPIPPGDVLAGLKLYTSTVDTDQYGNVRSNRYAAGDSIVAQFSRTTGLAICYPTGDKGEYILVNERYVNNRARDFEVWNVGLDGRVDCGRGDDGRVYTNQALNVPQNEKIRADYEKVINDAPICKNEGQENPIVVQGRSVSGIKTKCSFQQEGLANALLQPKCIDVMEPGDCKLLFNACDPVMCPPSRCNLGGRYQVSDVIQTGIIGSAVMCLPNAQQGIIMPVCLTGIHAGLKALKSVLEGYQSCLEISLEKGENVGSCDYIRSVGVCELFWRQIITLFDIHGGLVDWLSTKLSPEPQGGVEYLTFKQNLKNVGDSFNYFTSEYSTSILAYYKGKGTELGSQVCQLAVRGKVPSVGEVLDKLSEPEDPPQFDAMFDEAPYIESAGEPLPIPGSDFGTREYSLYRVFYHIYAGTGYAPATSLLGDEGEVSGVSANHPVRYSVYLRGREQGLDNLYVVDPERIGISEGVMERGRYAQATVQRVAPKGYTEICVLINGKESCGFGKASTAFAVNYLNDQVVKGQTTSNITSADECVSGAQSASTSLNALALVSTAGNAESGAVAAGLGNSLTNTGLVRVCNPAPPTADASRWVKVGTCGNDRTGKSLGSCWLDRNSVSVKDVEAKKELQGALKALSEGFDIENILSAADARKILEGLNELRDGLMKRLTGVVQAQ